MQTPNDTTSTAQNVSPHVVKQALDTIRIVADCIKTAGELPSGHLYAMLANVLNLNEYNRIIEILCNAGLISNHNHLLKWELK